MYPNSIFYLNMKIDLKGKVKNTHLPRTKALLPLFEAIVNSIHSVEELSSLEDPCISIFVERDEDQGTFIDSDASFFPINSFKIVDNGIGFTETNFNSFETSDTTLKAAKGSKGVGRFMWLKAFDVVSISSIYEKNNVFYHRKFNFELSDKGIIDLSNQSTNLFKRETTVRLIGFKKLYQKDCPQKTLTIAKKIIEHCLIYFLAEHPPLIKLIDRDEIINLNEFFHNNIKSHSKVEKFTIKSKDFKIINLRLYHSDETEHRLHYCAQNREVSNEKLSKDIPDLGKKIKDEQGNVFTYMAYMSGKYFDEHVNSERTNFNILDKISLDFDDEITLEEIKQEALTRVRTHLDPFLTSVRKEKVQEIEQYVTSKAPQYRPLLKHSVDKLHEIPPGLSEEKLDLELYKLYSKTSIIIKEQSNEMLNIDVKDFNKYPEYTYTYNQFIEQFNDFGKSTLAQYIVHRKTILELFSNNLKKNEDGKFKLERDIHEIIFPLKSTSDDIDFESQNLGIIDEKLSYHKYLASDKSFAQMQLTGESVNGDNRPDLIVFNHPFAFADGDLPYSSIVIIEFKRPMRENYADIDDPIRQVYKYIREIQSGEITDKDGRLISISASTPFYGYIICDITPKIKDFAKDAGLIDSPDHGGYFGYNKNYNAYLEVISFDKLILDAKKRNNVLFEKLHLPISS